MEIEVKIPIDRKTLYKNLKDKLDLGATVSFRVDYEEKYDKYWTNDHNKSMVRTRETTTEDWLSYDQIEHIISNGTLMGPLCARKVTKFLTVKNKKIGSDGEFNEENEYVMEHPEEVIKSLGYRNIREKVKKCLSFRFKECTVDISLWTDDVAYFECESTGDEASMTRVKEVCDFFGYDISKNDSRSWPEIIESLNKVDGPSSYKIDVTEEDVANITSAIIKDIMRYDENCVVGVSLRDVDQGTFVRKDSLRKTLEKFKGVVDEELWSKIYEKYGIR